MILPTLLSAIVLTTGGATVTATAPTWRTGSTSPASSRSGTLAPPPPAIARAITAAVAVYGVPYWQAVAVSRCETAGWTDFYNERSKAAGLFQFLASTWLSTPFADVSRFNLYANALAAGWLWRHDGKSWREWTCQP